ncbi:hypothetical protein L208DRAFT_1254439 [Tricholoma matsutake]|nr:hypothetical protein L208DRAFT_1254439 [Tricholoma matsutake 945]
MHTRCSSNSPPPPAMDAQAPSHCSWSMDDEECMITFLCSKKEASADGANFRLTIWNALAVEMALHHGTGAPKTVKACKLKYAQMCTTSQTPQSFN